MEIQKTSLHEEHKLLNAKMAPFAGFDMPLQYTSVKEEVIAVRTNVGMFDVSHMGEFLVDGPHAILFVDFIITNDLINAALKKAVYSPLCRDDGTIIDDLIAYKLSENQVLICVNASNIKKDWDWIKSKITPFNCKLRNLSDSYSLIALQGPNAEKTLKETGLLIPDNFPYYSIMSQDLEKDKLLIARTGYTGEDGFEIFSSHTFAKILWKKLKSMGVTPCGLAARDVLRLEACYPLYGHELTDLITPIDAGLSWTVKQNKAKYIGKTFLENYKPQYRLVKLSLERGIPREGYEILDQNKKNIGKVTSGTMSVVTGKGIAMALIQNGNFEKIEKYYINIRNTHFEANLQTKPFVAGGHK